MLVIWGRNNSVNVQKALWCCEELGLAYKRVDAGGTFGVVNTPEYRRLNPNGLVPTIDDDGFVLWESNAIVRYLAGKHGQGGVFPAEPRTRALADQWMDWQVSLFWPTIRPLFMGLVRTPEPQRDMQAIESARAKTAETLGILDAHLASRRFLAGDAFTIADIPMGCSIWRWMMLPIQRPRQPNVERWFDALKQRPTYEKIVMLPLS
jgi:glutathione S-transferase